MYLLCSVNKAITIKQLQKWKNYNQHKLYYIINRNFINYEKDIFISYDAFSFN